MKRCSKCQVDKPEAAFGKNVGNKDGLTSWCKVCRSLHRAPRKPSEAEYNKRYLATHAGALRERASPEKRAARIVVGNAVRDGKLRKTVCIVCGDAKSEAHHPDYSRPLDVVWLCKKHHAECHKLASTALHVEQPQLDLHGMAMAAAAFC